MIEHHHEAITEPICYKDRLKQIRALQDLSLEKKIELSEAFITHLLCDHKQPVVAWSGGRDSTVLLSLVLRQKPDVDVAWVNTGVEFPECMRFVRCISGEWHLNLHIAKPETNFWNVAEKYGWPMLGKGGSGYWWSRAEYLERKGKTRLAKATRAARISAACCRILKEKPMNKLCRNLEVDCVIVGNLVSESRQRFLTWAQKGPCYFSKQKMRCSASPLSWWTHEDILEFHKRFNMPYSPIYDMGHSRNGCWPCLMDIRFTDNKLRALRQSHPRLWRFLIIDKGLGERLLSVKLALGGGHIEQDIKRWGNNIQGLIEFRPDYFDTL